MLLVISKETNNHIKDHSTVDYYNFITKEKKLKTEEEFKSILNKHAVSNEGIEAFLNQDYEKFIEARSLAIRKILNESFGLEIRLTSVEEEQSAIENEN